MNFTAWSMLTVTGVGGLVAAVEAPASHDAVTIVTVVVGAIVTSLTSMQTTRAEMKKMAEVMTKVSDSVSELVKNYADLRSSHTELTYRVVALEDLLDPEPAPRTRHRDGRPITKPRVLPPPTREPPREREPKPRRRVQPPEE